MTPITVNGRRSSSTVRPRTFLSPPKLFLPKIITENDFESARSATSLFILARKITTEAWVYFEHVEKLRARFDPAHAYCPLLTGKRSDPIAVNRHARQCSVLLSKVEEIGIGKRPQLARRYAVARTSHPESHQLFRIRKRQRLEQESVDDAEDRGVCPDAERERDDRNRRERRVLNQLPQREAEIVHENFIQFATPELDRQARRGAPAGNMQARPPPRE